MNALGRDIKKGEKVVLKAGLLKPEYDTLEWRTVTATDGFGMLSSTAGSKIFIEFKDGSTTMWDARALSKSETKKLQKQEVKP